MENNDIIKANKFVRFPMANPSYLGIATNDPEQAFAVYKSCLGCEPTVIIARPNYKLISEHPLVVRSRFGIANGLLLSHLVSPNQVEGKELDEVFYALPASKENHDLYQHDPNQYKVHANKVGRPHRNRAICPHCQGKIEDFNNLGFWWGWQYGIIPTYWEDLKDYVFARDKYRCGSCKNVFARGALVAHHIEPKENGGEDGARNLVTLCRDCHQDSKPIMPDNEE